MSTRSAPSHWLLGKSISNFSTARLPRGLDVLRVLQFYHFDEGNTLPVSYKKTCDAVLCVWERARIPTQRVDSCVRKLSRLYEQYLLLKKNRARESDNNVMRQNMFQNDLEKLFDIATKDALSTIKNEEDRLFLQKQRESVFSSSMGSADLVTASKENRKRQRAQKEDNFKKRYARSETNERREITGQLSSSSSETSENEVDFQPTPYNVKLCQEQEPKASSSSDQCINIFKSPEVVAALDRVNLPDRGAVFVASAIFKALGHDVSDKTISRSSVRRSRRVERERAAQAERTASEMEGPLLLHWDGKLLPDIDGSKTKVDRIAILVTGNGNEKLLAIPKIYRGTGKAQAQACVDTITEWNMTHSIKGLVFDTTASNTGLHTGACTEIEKALECELVWLACRHHIMEIVLSAAFTCLFGCSGAPEVGLFNRFQKKWPSFDYTVYNAAENKLFENPILNSLRGDLLGYLPNALKKQQPRDDYKEFLTLSLLFLGGGGIEISFRAPGPTHHARWMAKAIYAIKIYLFREQFHLTSREFKNIEQFALFAVLAYVRNWNEAPQGIKAPLNDVQFLETLKSYPNKKISEKTYTAFARHLWFLSEHLIAFAFFDDRVSLETKDKMVQNLNRPKKTNFPRRIDAGTMMGDNVQLESFVTERTLAFFDMLADDGKRKCKQFLKLPSINWPSDKVYVELQEKCTNIRVVNDTAERGISLIQKYNQTLTKDEEQKQYILRLVSNHRKQFPVPSKSSLI